MRISNGRTQNFRTREPRQISLVSQCINDKAREHEHSAWELSSNSALQTAPSLFPKSRLDADFIQIDSIPSDSHDKNIFQFFMKIFSFLFAIERQQKQIEDSKPMVQED